jgi:O-antigen ligase
MHILAVRTGLVILYLSVFVLLCIRLSQRNELRWSIISLLILCFFAVLTPRLIPSLHTKIGYMYHDWQMYREGTGALYNDSDRIESLAIGWKLIQRNPIVGVGMGDLRKECVVEYKKTGRTDSYKLPHSQLVYVWAGCGIIGLILFLSGFYGPLWAVGWRSSYFLGFLYLNYSLSFLVENSLERSFSLAFFLFFALLNIRIGHKKSTI